MKKTKRHVQNRDAFENFMTWFQKTEHVYVLHATSAAYSVSQLSLYHRQYSSHSAAGRVESFFPSMDGISAWGWAALAEVNPSAWLNVRP